MTAVVAIFVVVTDATTVEVEVTSVGVTVAMTAVQETDFQNRKYSKKNRSLGGFFVPCGELKIYIDGKLGRYCFKRYGTALNRNPRKRYAVFSD
jgi:hypothetical protein